MSSATALKRLRRARWAGSDAGDAREDGEGLRISSRAPRWRRRRRKVALEAAEKAVQEASATWNAGARARTPRKCPSTPPSRAADDAAPPPRRRAPPRRDARRGCEKAPVAFRETRAAARAPSAAKHEAEAVTRLAELKTPRRRGGRRRGRGARGGSRRRPRVRAPRFSRRRANAARPICARRRRRACARRATRTRDGSRGDGARGAGSRAGARERLRAPGPGDELVHRAQRRRWEGTPRRRIRSRRRTLPPRARPARRRRRWRRRSPLRSRPLASARGSSGSSSRT